VNRRGLLKLLGVGAVAAGGLGGAAVYTGVVDLEEGDRPDPLRTPDPQGSIEAIDWSKAAFSGTDGGFRYVSGRVSEPVADSDRIDRVEAAPVDGTSGDRIRLAVATPTAASDLAVELRLALDVAGTSTTATVDGTEVTFDGGPTGGQAALVGSLADRAVLIARADTVETATALAEDWSL
jgi:hypothetical protein